MPVLFTIFTPTYNRAHTLHRVFESLAQQTFTDFEWLIVDDGSTDTTEAVIEAYKMKSAFPIRYFYQPNQGKHIAFNKGVQEAKGLFFLTFDSDDACIPTALECYKDNWENIEDKEKFCGVTARCLDQNGYPLSKKHLPPILDVNSLDLRYKYGINEEMWGFTRTDILCQFPFPETIKNSWVPENMVWSEVGHRYKTRYINTPLRIYYTNEAHGSVVTALKTSRKTNDSGRIMYYSYAINNELHYFFYAPVLVAKLFIQYVRVSLKENISLSRQWHKMKGIAAKSLFLCLFPVGFFFFLTDYLTKSE
jgi:glycosyltransferase involved in cell wall biosynthesis